VSERPSVAVVVPVRDAADDVTACLQTILPQARDLGAEVIVVDDASADGTARLAEAAGARVLRLPAAGGPYAARNAGWRSTAADVIVFTDVRNRASEGWLAALVAALDDPGAAVAGGTVEMAGDDRVAHRWARRDRRLDVARHLRDGWLPYVPTASMAVRRDVLDRAGGFLPTRSGGDVDLCWRIQLAGLGAIVAVPDSLMRCVPRSTVREVLRQWDRYGTGHLELYARFAHEGCPVPDPEPAAALGREVVRAALGIATRRRRDLAVEVVEQARRVVWARAYRRAWRARPPRAGLTVAYVVDRWVALSETFIRDEIAELRRQGVRIAVVALGVGDTAPSDEEPAARLDRVASTASPLLKAKAAARRPAATVRMLAVRRAMAAESPPALWTIPLVAEQMRAEGVGWVHAHFGWEASGVAQMLAAHLGTGWSFTAHANDISVRNEHLSRKLEQADHVVTVCRYNADLLEKAGRRADAVDVVVCGVRPPPLSERLADARVDVLAVGRLVEKKGFDVLIDAVELLVPTHPRLRVEIVGDGPERDRLADRIAARHVAGQVQLVGARPHATVLEMIGAASVVCLPCRIAADGDRDAMPVVLKEAMARAVPVVATAVAGIPEAVDDEVGRLVRPDDPAALAKALADLLDAPETARAAGRAGRARVLERFSLEAEVGRLRELFAEWSLARPGRRRDATRWRASRGAAPRAGGRRPRDRWRADRR
jgi:colanic acid/amylovoran biosynthesis glycosyltransferase